MLRGTEIRRTAGDMLELADEHDLGSSETCGGALLYGKTFFVV